MAKEKVIGAFGAYQAFIAKQILSFAATSAQATESNPLKLGNVEFWIGEGVWRGVLTFSIPTYAWDKESVQSALNTYLADKQEELKTYLHITDKVADNA
jgi:hypothetical protein